MVEEWKTARLLARPPQLADEEDYGRIFLDPAVAEWLRPAPMKQFDPGEVAEMLGEDRRHWVEHGFGPWALVAREDDSVVGRGGLRWTEIDGHLTVELPWAVSPDRWGQGLATEAASAAVECARALGLAEVAALVLPGNLRSRRVAEKAGLKLTGDTLHAGIPHLVYRLDLAI
ncbi:MAG: GNAT family N-acetyltransferase [Solirubrobacterales bacterium]